MTSPDTLQWIAPACLVLAGIPAVLTLLNLPLYRRLPRVTRSYQPADVDPNGTIRVSVLIPARNEEASISEALQSALANPRPDFEVLVLDDHSTDRTAALVLAVASRDPRVRLLSGDPLPPGWCGKQHACWQLAHHARGELLVFVDADVRLSSDAIPRIAESTDQHPDVHLLSGVPCQITGTLLERLLIPLIHFVLLGFLPMLAAQRTRRPAFAAGCGQLFVARRAAYFACQGHSSLRDSLHDGVRLPRAFRASGFQTGLFDATDIATCRMYTSNSEVWKGLGKNATEGMAGSVAIAPWTLLLLGGHVLPWILLAASLFTPTEASPYAMAAAACGVLTRLVSALRFRQSILSALLHPFGIAALVAIQWQARFRHWRRQPLEWRGRRYASAVTVPAVTRTSP